MLQTWLTGLIVCACASHATWVLMPKAWRRALGHRVLGRDPQPVSGCGGCEGCAAPTPAAAPVLPGLPPGQSVVRFQRNAARSGGSAG